MFPVYSGQRKHHRTDDERERTAFFVELSRICVNFNGLKPHPNFQVRIEEKQTLVLSFRFIASLVVYMRDAVITFGFGSEFNRP